MHQHSTRRELPMRADAERLKSLSGTSNTSVLPGPTYDIVQREYVAMTIADSFGMNVTAQDVIGASAEETTGFVNASAPT